MKTIGENAFRQISNITSLSIGSSVTSIGKNAFCGCNGLTEVTLPNSVVTIENGAFYGCYGLKSVSFGSSVKTIGDYAFYECSSLISVTIPNSVTSIGDDAFDNCSALTLLSIGNSVTSIGSMAFYKCSALTDIYNYSTTPQDISSNTFSNYSATLHVLPDYGTAYGAAKVWKDFQKIVEDATNGVPDDDKPKLSLSASPSGGDVTAGTKVYLTAKANSSEVSGASIYYTLNGTTPSKNSTAYTSSGITINASCTLKAIAYKDGYEDSDVMEESYNTVTITGIAINETNFPDANFRKYLLEQDYGSDGVLTETEIAEITYMDLPGTDIENLKGIEYFKGLEYLSCSDNKLTSLDVSGCSNLRGLFCSLNKLTSLDVSGCSMLNFLYCNDNQLTSLDVSGCSELYLLYVYQNKIKDAAMDAFIKSLPTVSNGQMSVIVGDNEGNAMTTAQVAAAKAKGWTPYYSDGELDDWGGYSWQEYAGSDDGNTLRGTLENPFTPAEANAFGKSLAANEQSEADYYISGVVSNVKEQFGTQYGNATFYISADGSDTDQFYVYRANYLGNTKYAGQELNIRVGDEVVVCGKITNYKGTLPETVEGKAYVVSINGDNGGQDQLGDVNRDGIVDVRDVVCLVKYIMGSQPVVFIEAMADVNGDGKIDTQDVAAMVNMIKN